MNSNYILSDYIEQALEISVFEILDDGSFCGTIPVCMGVLAFGNTLNETYKELK